MTEMQSRNLLSQGSMPKRKFTLVPIICLAICLPALASAEGSFQRTLQVSGSTSIDLTTGSGNVNVRTGTSGQVQITGQVKVTNWFGGDSEKQLKTITDNPPIQQSGNDIRIGNSGSAELFQRFHQLRSRRPTGHSLAFAYWFRQSNHRRSARLAGSGIRFWQSEGLRYRQYRSSGYWFWRHSHPARQRGRARQGGKWIDRSQRHRRWFSSPDRKRPHRSRSVRAWSRACRDRVRRHGTARGERLPRGDRWKRQHLCRRQSHRIMERAHRFRWSAFKARL